MIKSHTRGWPIIYEKGLWLYIDNKETIMKNRPCKRCDQPSTASGHDACIGTIQGAISVCCGHGAEKGFIIRKEIGGENDSLD